MPSADYKCRECGHIVELELPADQCEDLPCSEGRLDSDGASQATCRFDRVWSAPSIGRVEGAGGSPAR